MYLSSTSNITEYVLFGDGELHQLESVRDTIVLSVRSLIGPRNDVLNSSSVT